MISKDVLEEIKESDAVETAALYYTRNEYDAVFNGSQSLSNGTIMGVDSDYLDVYGYQITKGRGFSEKDFSENRKVALLDKTSASNLFPDGNVIGKTIEMKGEPFTVIGLIARKAAPQRMIIIAICQMMEVEWSASLIQSGRRCISMMNHRMW